VWKIKILARDVSDSTPIRRKMRGGILSAFSVLPLSDILEYIPMCIMSVFLHRSDETIFDMSLIT
jgi:hypothetical protein